MFCLRQANPWQSHRKAELFSLEEAVCEQEQPALTAPRLQALWCRTSGSPAQRCPPRCPKARGNPHTPQGKREPRNPPQGPHSKKRGLYQHRPNFRVPKQRRSSSSQIQSRVQIIRQSPNNKAGSISSSNPVHKSLSGPTIAKLICNYRKGQARWSVYSLKSRLGNFIGTERAEEQHSFNQTQTKGKGPV